MPLLDISAVLTHAQAKQHLAHPFTLPPGATHLRIGFRYGPEKVAGQHGRNLLSLSLFDPNGSRGAGHNRADNSIALSAVEATPGFTIGELPAGEWALVIDTHMVLPGGDITYHLTIDADAEPLTGDAPRYAKNADLPRGKGWYRGDLHSHTIHSDGSWDVPDLVAAARSYGLDFMTLTDHNTVSPLPQVDSLATPDLLTMGGLELTTYYGHALTLGVRHWVDWRVDPHDGTHRTMRDIAATVEAGGGLFVIAHPMSPGDPDCTGCDWRYQEMWPGTARAVEVWNGFWSPYNEDGLALWYRWLNQGYRLVATAGTDAHGPTPLIPRVGFNVVYAESLSETAILAAIRRGHSYLAADGHRLILTAQTLDGETGMMGDTLHGSQAEVTADWGTPESGSQIRLIVDGAAFETFATDEAGSKSWRLPISSARWCVAELRDRDSLLCALTNPIFFEP